MSTQWWRLAFPPYCRNLRRVLCASLGVVVVACYSRNMPFGKRIKAAMGHGLLKVMGWETQGAPPPQRRYVLIAAPHTTNWDLPLMLALSFVYDVPVRWMGKQSLFVGPLGPFFTALGGLPIVRHERRNVVDQMVELFHEREELVLAVPAEGTRSRAAHWKSGFYHIAHRADVPVVLGFLDYATRRGGFGPAVRATGDIGHDMQTIREFYADKWGKHPENFGAVRLKEEHAQLED